MTLSTPATNIMRRRTTSIVTTLVLAVSFVLSRTEAAPVEEQSGTTTRPPSQGGHLTPGNCSVSPHLSAVLSLLNSPSILQHLPSHPLPPTPGDKHCPSSFDLMAPPAPLKDRSSCPWYLEVEMLGEEFIPSYLLTARCRCRQCLTSTVMGCETVQADVRLLRLTGCQGDAPSVEVTTRQVAVGCTCAQAITFVPDNLEPRVNEDDTAE